MLITTIELETNDDQLFSKSAPLLSAASELSYHTMDCSALNAEELRRENGIQTLHSAFARCISTLSAMSRADELAVQVCHIIIVVVISNECNTKVLERFIFRFPVWLLGLKCVKHALY